MSSLAQRWLIVGAMLGAGGVLLGAYSAHGLESRLTEAGFQGQELTRRHTIFETAVRYQMFHALAIVLVAIALDHHPAAAWRVAAWAFLVGIVLFSGLLYVLTFAGEAYSKLGMIVPGGGILLVIGWLALAVGGIRARSDV